MIRVALYTRVSTEDQAKEGFSLSAQLERLRYYARAQGWIVTGEYVDEGHSGRTTKRPQYARMMQEIDKWDTLLVLKMDRIHRNSRNFMGMMDLLRKKGKEFASVTESLDTSTAMGRFVMDIIQRIAQLESDQIGERTFVGMDQKAKMGGGNLGKKAPYGYRYDLHGILRPVQEGAVIVAEIFSRFEGGEGKQAIADDLNRRGITSPAGGKWRFQAIDWILANPTYAGAIGWKGRLQLGVHESIVSAELFDAVQRRLSKRSRRPLYVMAHQDGPGLAEK